VLHFLYKGDTELAKQLCAEADGTEVETRLFDFFETLSEIMRDLNNESDDLLIPTEKAVRWAQEHANELRKAQSDLLFELLKLRFLQLVHQEQNMQAVEYAREHLAMFSDTKSSEINSMMGSLVFPTKNTDLLRAQTKLCQVLFPQEACLTLGLPAHSPLETALRAGKPCLEQLCKYFKVFGKSPGSEVDAVVKLESICSSSSNSSSADKTYGAEGFSENKSWIDMGELPVSVQLAKDLVFHSSFICPVTKQQTNDMNYPVLLKCGHVLSHESMQRISKAGGRLKCPTCTAEQHQTYSCPRVYF
jgi:hypothetical protein